MWFESQQTKRNSMEFHIMVVQRFNRIIKEKGENVIHSICSQADIPKYIFDIFLYFSYQICFFRRIFEMNVSEMLINNKLVLNSNDYHSKSTNVKKSYAKVHLNLSSAYLHKLNYVTTVIASFYFLSILLNRQKLHFSGITVK